MKPNLVRKKKRERKRQNKTNLQVSVLEKRGYLAYKI